MHTKAEKLESFAKALEIMDTLREKCPWNGAQTTQSLRPMTVEEVYELSDAVLRGDDEDLRKELGDVFLHIIFYAKIAEEEGHYDIKDVIDGLCDKMVFRHPHVFGNGAPEGLTEEEVAKNWELVKTREKGGNRTILGGVPKSFPPVLKAYAMQDKARSVGFDWEEPSQVWDKVDEELGEVKAAIAEEGVSANPSEAAGPHTEEEFGDLLFALIKCARNYNIQAENALEKTNRKFKARFQAMESLIQQDGKQLKNMQLSEMEHYYYKAKEMLNQKENL